MKIAITQREHTINEFTYDCLSTDWYKFLPSHQIIPVPNVQKFDLSTVDMLILSGGDITPARAIVEQQCYKDAIELDLPVLGICHGAFMLNTWRYGINGNINNHYDTEHEITFEGKQFIVNSYHKLCIGTLGEGLNAIAWCHQYVEAFEDTSKNTWGLLWHPERMENPVLPNNLRKLLYV